MIEPLPKTGRSVLLYSGGLDSFILLRLLQPHRALRISIGSKYDQIEQERCREIQRNQWHLDVDYLEDDRLHLGDLERTDALIPMRNAFFAMIASFYGDNIILGATVGDNSRDKEPLGFFTMSTMLTYLARDPHYKDPNRTVQVIAPAKHITKAQLLAAYIKDGQNLELLKYTISCYTPIKNKPCGNCKSCVRRWAAFAFNGLPDFESYAQNPWQSTEGLAELQRAKAQYRGAESSEVISAFKTLGIE